MPKTQTKEEIEADLNQLRHKALTDYANELTSQIIASVEAPVEVVMVAGMILGAALGNSVMLNEESAKLLFADVFKNVETTARGIMTRRANLEAISQIFGGSR